MQHVVDNDLSPYPWGGPYIRNARGCFLGNFKPMRGSYIDLMVDSIPYIFTLILLMIMGFILYGRKRI
jgi:hypothetical protein